MAKLTRKDFESKYQSMPISYIDRKNRIDLDTVANDIYNNNDIQYIKNKIKEYLVEIKIQWLIALKIHYIAGDIVCEYCSESFKDLNTYSPHVIKYHLMELEKKYLL